MVEARPVSDSRSEFSYRDISHTALRGYVQLFLYIVRLAQTCDPMTQTLLLTPVADHFAWQSTLSIRCAIIGTKSVLPSCSRSSRRTYRI
jgi:hypothetical protein